MLRGYETVKSLSSPTGAIGYNLRLASVKGPTVAVSNPGTIYA